MSKSPREMLPDRMAGLVLLNVAGAHRQTQPIFAAGRYVENVRCAPRIGAQRNTLHLEVCTTQDAVRDQSSAARGRGESLHLKELDLGA